MSQYLNANVQESNSIPLLELDTLDMELDTSPINFNSDTKIGSSHANKYLHKNNQPNSPSMLAITPHRRKRRKQSRNATVTENSGISDEDEVIEASPTQRSVASKVRQFLELKRNIAKKRIDFGSCPSPKHTVNTLKDKVNISHLPVEQTANRNKINNFNLDDTENKPPEKKMLVDNCNACSKRKNVSEQVNMRCKSDRAKLKSWDCWECREYYNNLSLPKEELQKRKNQCSRHRYKYERPNTPEGFWDPEFPETLSSTYRTE
ncbi:uncharacterized protein [Temnothorax nylanderi]|uniref:uncharacterized protein n=1 Tax=Temnothorax nylanderi TaxID=102681 RepID=UPI003A8420E4